MKVHRFISLGRHSLLQDVSKMKVLRLISLSLSLSWLPFLTTRVLTKQRSWGLLTTRFLAKWSWGLSLSWLPLLTTSVNEMKVLRLLTARIYCILSKNNSKGLAQMFLQGRQLMILRCWLRLMLDAAIQADCCWSLRLLADEFSVSFKTVETVVWKKMK